MELYKLENVTRNKWGEDPQVFNTLYEGIYDANASRHGGYLVDITINPELKGFGAKTIENNIRAFEEDYEALKVLWLFPKLIKSKENVYKWLNKDTVIKYDDNKKFIEKFPERIIEKEYIDTPAGKELQKRLDKLVEKVWEGLEDIPFYEKESIQYIDEDYFEFKKGTEKEEIWHWFDENHSKGIHFLLYEYKKNETEEELEP